MTPPPRPRRAHQPTAALFVRIPAEQADRLDRAAFALGRAKQDLVASALEHYVDPDSPEGLSALQVDAPTAGRRPRPIQTQPPDLLLGHHHFVPDRADEATPVLTVQQAAELLQVKPEVVAAMAESGELPARRMGGDWRLSRSALIDWLGRAPSAGSDPPPVGSKHSQARPTGTDR